MGRQTSCWATCCLHPVLLILARLSAVLCEIVTWTCANFWETSTIFESAVNNSRPNRIQIWQNRHFRVDHAIFGGRR
ncbi:hypothetical protein BGY98DRAFT_966316, partial [Russula aff. rugulosa BPL654]